MSDTKTVEKNSMKEKIDIKSIIARLTDKDDRKAYEYAKHLNAESAASNKYYSCFEDFLSLIDSSSSYVRTRGFQLCCSQARWDSKGKIEKALPQLCALLNDEKPTVVRQCLNALHEVILYLPQLGDKISNEIDRIDLTKYKDSMTPLIQKDIDELKKMLD